MSPNSSIYSMIKKVIFVQTAKIEKVLIFLYFKKELVGESFET